MYDWLKKDSKLPWKIKVCFQGQYPTELLHYSGEETIKSHWINCLKEAQFVESGDIQKFNHLSVVDTAKLWEGFKTSTFFLV